MRNIAIDIPFGLSFTLRTRVPGTLSIKYIAPKGGTTNDAPMPLAELSNHRIRDGEEEEEEEESWREVRVDVPLPPSPQVTEKAYNPDDPENQQDYWVEQLQQMGIHARDFGVEPYPNDLKAPEIFDPCIAFLKYGLGVKLTIREVRQLTSLGWLTVEQAQAQARMSPEEWSSCTCLPEYPWMALNFERPTGTHEEILASLRRQLSLTYPGRKKIRTSGTDAPIDVNINGNVRKDNEEPGNNQDMYDLSQDAPIQFYNDHKRPYPAEFSSYSPKEGDEVQSAGPSRKRQKRSPFNDIASSDPHHFLLDSQFTNTNAGPSSLGADPYFTPPQITSPTYPEEYNSSPFSSSASGGPVPVPSPPQAQSRGLARTQTLWRF